MASESAPERSYMDDPAIVWRHSKPNFGDVDLKYLAERTRNHKVGSLEKIVENLVKTWEMESSHKVRAQDWRSVDKNNFTISANGDKKFNLDENIKLGNYNMLMSTSCLYDASVETNDSSQELFRNVFKTGFAWELLDLFSGPPVVSFTWRHWGHWEGDYRDSPATGELIEMFGSCVVKVSSELKIQSIEVFYDPNIMLKVLTRFQIQGNGMCPFKK